MKYMDFVNAFTAAVSSQKEFEAPKPDLNAALAHAGIPPDAPYYSGALECVRKALRKKGDLEAVRFWAEYQLSLCKQLQSMETETGRETVKEAIKTVKAVLCAMRN